MDARTMKRLAPGVALLAGAATAALLAFGSHPAHAYVRGGGVAAGGFRAASQTTWVPGVGVSRTTVAAGGYYGGRYARFDEAAEAPSVTSVARGGVVVSVTARDISGAFTYDPGTGMAYRYGPAVSTLPAGCSAAFWNGTGAWSCSGTTYAYDIINGAPTYYPVYF